MGTVEIACKDKYRLYIPFASFSENQARGQIATPPKIGKTIITDENYLKEPEKRKRIAKK